MKKTVLLIGLTVLIITLSMGGCKKDELSTLKCHSIDKGGCFLEKGSSFKGDNPPIDTLFSRLSSDTLALGFNANCCSEFNCSVSIKDDLITVTILTTTIGTCDCVCYYTYAFKFTGSGTPRKYSIKVFFDDELKLDTYFNFPFR